MNNAIWLSGEPVSVVDLPYWPNNSCFFSGVKYIKIKVLWCASFTFPEEYAPGSTPRQIILTLDPAGAWRKDMSFFVNGKPFSKEKELTAQYFQQKCRKNNIKRAQLRLGGWGGAEMAEIRDFRDAETTETQRRQQRRRDAETIGTQRRRDAETTTKSGINFLSRPSRLCCLSRLFVLFAPPTKTFHPQYYVLYPLF